MYTSVEQAISLIQPGNRVFVHGSACTPNYLMKEIANQQERLHDIEFTFITVLMGLCMLMHLKFDTNLS